MLIITFLSGGGGMWGGDVIEMCKNNAAKKFMLINLSALAFCKKGLLSTLDIHV